MDRRRLLLWSSNWRALAVIALAAAIALEAHPSIAVALVFAGTAIGTGSYPAVLAVLPGTVPERDLVPATTLVNAAETAAWLLGPAVGGLLVMSTDPAWSLMANAVLFGIGALVLVPTRARPAASDSTAGVLVDIAAGARIIVADARIRCPLILVTGVNLVVGAAPIVLLVGSDRWFGADGTQFALLSAALGFGGFCVVAATTRLARRTNVMATLTCTSVASCVPFAVLALAMGPASGVSIGPFGPVAPALAVILVAGAGAAMVATEVVAITVMLRHLPDEVTARVIGLVDSTLVAAVLVGSVAAGPMIAVLGLEATVLALALVVPAAAVAASRWRRHHASQLAAPAIATVG
jgi:predicted MFS family arabinose efflux permease